jgi:hypothetical protein
VGRAALFIAVLAGLAVSGHAFVQRWGSWQLLPKGPTNAQQAGAELRAAAGTLEQAHAMVGTYSANDLSVYRGLSIAYADDAAYCIQVFKGVEAFHLAGPRGLPRPGRC